MPGGLIEDKIKNFIDSLSAEQISVAKEIMFFISSRDLINKVKKIYEQPNTDANNVSIDQQ